LLHFLGELLLKSLVASQLVNVFSPLQTNHQAIKELNEAFYHFLWDGKPDKIKRNVIIIKYSDGGLKMTDLSSLNNAVFSGSLDKKDTKNHFQASDTFINEILLIWAEVNFNCTISSSVRTV